MTPKLAAIKAVLLLFLCNIATNAFAQNIKVTGIVKNKLNGTALAGAVINVKGSSLGRCSR